MKISTRLNILGTALVGIYIFLFIYTFSSFRTFYVSLEDVHSAEQYLANLNSCDELLLRQLTEGQRILLSGEDSIDGESLVRIRLQKSRLGQRIEELQTMKVPAGLRFNSVLLGSFGDLYEIIDSELIKKLFDNEAVNAAETSELIMEKYSAIQSELTKYESETDAVIVEILRNKKNMIGRCRLIFTSIFIAVAGLIGVTVGFIRFHVLKTVRDTSNEMAKLADGNANLEFRFGKIPYNEMGELCRNFNGFLSNMDSMMSRIRDAGSLASELGNRLESDINENLALSEDFRDSIEFLSLYFDDLIKAVGNTDAIAASICSTSADAGRISAEQNRLISEAESVATLTVDSLERIREKGNDNLRRAESLTSAAGDGLMVINELSDSIEAISSSAESLLMINDVINDISDRTNILGINAAIEASRAGAAGAGFRVVSREISELAALVRHNADITGRTLNEATRAIGELKEKSESGRNRFRLIEDNSAGVCESVRIMTGSLMDLAGKQSEMMDTFGELSNNSSLISEIIIMMDGNVSGFLDSLRSLEENFSAASEKLADADGGIGKLGSITRRLVLIGEENHNMAESLNSYIEHFTAG